MYICKQFESFPNRFLSDIPYRYFMSEITDRRRLP